MAKISFKGVIIGSITDIVSTSITSVPVVFYLVHSMTKAGMSKAEIHTTLLTTLRTDPFYLTLGLILGGLCSILGGYIAAKIAKENELVNGALASFLCVGSGLYSLYAGTSGQPWWLDLIEIVISIILATLGGYICRARKAKYQVSFA